MIYIIIIVIFLLVLTVYKIVYNKNNKEYIRIKKEIELSKKAGNPIVAVIRSELIDKETCKYCREILDLKVVKTDDPNFKKYFLKLPHAGCRGVNIYICESEREEYRNDPRRKFIPPTVDQLKWINEK
ncbi:MAG: hypothetical protein KJ620_04460 [Candidatus Edwardsbacteria bacterium]|nr:hypothetical protein [Candidatus Edwardsbacteria bacterium]MBU1575770.1 hypothetical protein [Candidatus Edwardsbacteria bacterium]MBU2464013.1 hypothetical protein [Candidatus Edwardsbacteria bacterium]MBU2593231.1 hypothetical protein [Candidatus Edwardsbacteria bacterium]